MRRRSSLLSWDTRLFDSSVVGDYDDGGACSHGIWEKGNKQNSLMSISSCWYDVRKMKY